MLKVITAILCLSQIVLAVNGQTRSEKNKESKIIQIDGKGSGRIFDGVGAVSAGSSSRLLIDYSEKDRSNILDYLFKPNFGAGFTYLKTEIGGDGNTTCGSEPSFARTKAEMDAPNYKRGFEYWLMKEATNRNPGIELDALEWSMPGWFNGIWSQDNADYLVKFIQGARHWGLNMKYIAGCWNERDYNRDWIVNTLRPTLDKSGLPLWSGEDFSLPGKSWRNTTYLAKNILKCYIKWKIVKVNMWCPIASMPDIACFSNVGLMKGTNPWSGYYEVWPTIWAVAHFN